MTCLAHVYVALVRHAMVIDNQDIEYSALSLILAPPQSWVFPLISIKDMETEFVVKDSLLLHNPHLEGKPLY